MSIPTDPKKVTIHARAVTVLEGIFQGDDYFYTPGNVQGKATLWKKRMADYELAVIFAGAEEAPTHHSGHRLEETFTLVIGGAIRDHDGETQKALARALRDIRKAVFADMDAGTTGSLGALAIRCQLGPWRSELGEGPLEGFGRFEQEFKFTVSGDIEDL